MIFGLCLTMISTPGFAASLTKSDIEAFYQEAAEVQKKGESQTLRFFEKHISDDAQVRITTFVKVPGAQTQEDVRMLTKGQMIADIKKGYKMGEIREIEYTVVSADIAPDRQSADVKDTNYSIMALKVPAPEGEVEVVTETTMFCSDRLVLNKKGHIQITKSECTAESEIVSQE